MDVKLRSQCRSLLDQLKSSQRTLTELLPSPSSEMDTEVGGKKGLYGVKFNNSHHPSPNFQDSIQKPAYARNKLSEVSKTPQSQITLDNDGCAQVINHTSDRLASGMSGISQSRSVTQDTDLYVTAHKELRDNIFKNMNGNIDTSTWKSAVFDEMQKVPSMSSWYPATPNTIRKRQLIDRHTNVPSKLNADELKELNNERLLNFNYCHINVDDNITQLKSLPQTDGDKENTDLSGEQQIHKEGNNATSILSSKKQNVSMPNLSHKNFHEQLQDDGNNRNYGNWLKETTIKPKSLLNSSAYYSLNPNSKSSSRVRFDSSTTQDAPVLDQHLLGYDWIAALLDNDPNLMNQSESFFDEIRDFRKAFKDECSNHFYMESPYTLVDTEPEPVVDALTEPKVRPYVVNDRLFTEPLKPDLIDYEDDSNRKSKRGSKEPTENNPRFVRVSIPRSTLQTPYRVKPHRRGSFDGSDSCALMDHCLLGWENTRPIMMPSAKTLDLNTEAGTRIDSETTTLAEAERLANEHNRLKWPFSKPNARIQTLPTWRKHYMNTTLNMSLPPSSGNASTASSSNHTNHSSQGGRKGIKRATDRILSATYSTMYEMERLRQERELERKREQDERERV